MSNAELWTRRGVIFAPEDNHRWWRTHAQTPTPLVLGPRLWRIYLSARNDRNQARIVFVDVDPQDDMRVVDFHDEPLLPLGPPGTFDTAGQGVSMALPQDGALHIYYLGMHLRPDVPMGMGIGLAVSHDEGVSFERLSDGPVLAYNTADPYFCSLIHVAQRDATTLRSWYMTGTGWEPRDGAPPDPVYGIRRALSTDQGMTWRPDGATLGLNEGVFAGPVGIARPWLESVNGQERLWFSYRDRVDFREDRTAAYRIMYVPLDSAGDIVGGPRELRFANPPQPDDWDGFMQAYPTFVPFEGGYVMFYNGNGFGQTGFGWATLGL